MKKVLTVDDSKVVRTMVARHLQPYGCQVLEAANGREGVDVARKEQPDLILLDVTMPVMDGRQALAEIRQDAALKGTPVVMLTAESGKDLVLEIAKLGVKGYIVKPFTKATFARFNAASVWKPSMSGMTRSITATRGRSAANCATASAPLDAVSTFTDASSDARAAARTRSLSSTTSTQPGVLG